MTVKVETPTAGTVTLSAMGLLGMLENNIPAALDFRLLAEVIPQIVWTAHPGGSVDYYNQRWVEYSGITRDATLGMGWDAVVHPDDLAPTHARWEQAIITRANLELEFRLKRAMDGVYRWHLGRALAVRDGQGAIVKWVGTCTDIHDQKQRRPRCVRARLR